MSAQLIVNPTREPAAPAVEPRPCACERTRVYGLLCRWCAWRLLTPPPLPASPEPVESTTRVDPHSLMRTAYAYQGCEEARHRAQLRARRRDYPEGEIALNLRD